MGTIYHCQLGIISIEDGVNFLKERDELTFGGRMCTVIYYEEDMAGGGGSARRRVIHVYRGGDILPPPYNTK